MEFFQPIEKIAQTIKGLPENEWTFEYRMSAGGECQRKMEFDQIRGITQPDISVMIKTMSGTYLHEMWQHIMVAALGDDFQSAESEVELEFPTKDGMKKVMGHPDGVIGSLGAIWELKTVTDATFQMIGNNDDPIQAHYEQANLYAHALGLDKIWFQYFNRNSGASMYIMRPASIDLAVLTLKKFGNVYDNVKAGVVSPRTYTNPEDSPCWFCSHKEHCYEGYEKEVGDMTSVSLDTSKFEELYRDAKFYWHNRKERLDAEKREAEFRKRIGEQMIRMGHNGVTIGEYAATLKLGKNKNPIVTVKEAK